MNHFDASTGQAYGGIVRFWPGVDSYSYLDNFMATRTSREWRNLPGWLIYGVGWRFQLFRISHLRWWPRIVPRWNPLTSWMRQIEDFQRAA